MALPNTQPAVLLDHEEPAVVSISSRLIPLDPDDLAGVIGVETTPQAAATPSEPGGQGSDGTVLLLREAPAYVVFLDTASGEVRILRRAADRETYQPYVSLHTDGGSIPDTKRIASRIANLLTEHSEVPHAAGTVVGDAVTHHRARVALNEAATP